MLMTDAWVLHQGAGGDSAAQSAGAVLSREEFAFGEPHANEVLVEPLYGSWEANLGHALARQPIDVCRARGEESVVIGNLGVVRVLATGSSSRASAFREGDICMVLPFGKWDRHGFAELVYAYDMPHTIGLLAKRTKVSADILLPVPEGSAYSLPQWTAYGRYFTAWDNWRTALRCWQAQLPDADPSGCLVFGWGGGVTFAELQLARKAGFRVAMTASSDERLEMLRAYGIVGVDRRQFPDLACEQARDGAEPGKEAAARYKISEKQFLQNIDELADGNGVAIFIDNIGAPLYKATLKALGREGVLTTCGWKHGMSTPTRRAAECVRRHLHVHTHVWRIHESAAIRDYQESTGWIYDASPAEIYSFDDVPQLADDYTSGKLATYFPLFQVNAV